MHQSQVGLHSRYGKVIPDSPLQVLCFGISEAAEGTWSNVQNVGVEGIASRDVRTADVWSFVLNLSVPLGWGIYRNTCNPYLWQSNFENYPHVYKLPKALSPAYTF